MRVLFLAFILLFLVGCEENLLSPTTQPLVLNQSQPISTSFNLTPTQKIRAEQLISLFENSLLEMQYGYAEALGDGQGITAGRPGLTTANGGIYLVVKRFTQQVPNNSLAIYLPALSKLNGSSQDDLSSLDGFIEAWQSSGEDTVFHQVQDKLAEEMFYQPALSSASQLGLKTALAKVVLYDTIIQHGNDPQNPDSFSSLIQKTTLVQKGTPKTNADEKKWLDAFLSVRKADLISPSNNRTKSLWEESISRIDVFNYIVQNGNYDFSGPFYINVGEYQNITIN